MPRFSVSFTKRKPAADEPENAPTLQPEQSSFRVIERGNAPNSKSFDVGPRITRPLPSAFSKANLPDLNTEESLFADVKANRGSDVSNTTKATSADDSSWHSNASTDPSSADLGNGNAKDESAYAAIASAPQPFPARGASKSSFLDRTTRTFSFGVQKKPPLPPPKDAIVADLPPVLTLPVRDANPRSRATTASTASTATPTRLTRDPGLDLGGDFSSMFASLDRRPLSATRNHPDLALASTSQSDLSTPVSPEGAALSEPLLNPRTSSRKAGLPLSAYHLPQSVARKRSPEIRSPDMVEDEDAKLLQESFAAMTYLSSPDADLRRGSQAPEASRERAVPPARSTPLTTSPPPAKEENMFEGSVPRHLRPSQRTSSYNRTLANPPRNKVMTPAQFEKYRQDKEMQGNTEQAARLAAMTNNQPHNRPANDDEDDEINYDDDEDELEKSKQQARQRRKQEAHMAVYRQQMMKVTGEPTSTPLSRLSQPGLFSSVSTTQLDTSKTPSPDPATGAAAATAAADDDDEDDEDVPLGILQAHGFPHKNRPPPLSLSGSSSHLRSCSQGPPTGRPVSAMGDASSSFARRHSTLPAFARGLPQDPFVGASIARPALRESLSLGDTGQLPPHLGPSAPGGLVGVIVNEERSKAMRRGSPGLDSHKFAAAASMNGLHGPAFDPVAGIPHQMMYNTGSVAGMPQMPQMPHPALTPGDQAQIQMTQQMQQFMQMQMQFMQMMAASQGGVGQPQMPSPMLPPFGAAFPGSQSMADLTSRNSMAGDVMMDPPRRLDHGMRTMSMVQPSSSSFIQQPHYAASSIHGSGQGYAPSIAPSERSNVGLPGRYRPVSQSPAPSLLGQRKRLSMVSAQQALNTDEDKNKPVAGMDEDKSKAAVSDEEKGKPAVKYKKQGGRGGDSSNEDDEEKGWQAMKARRDKKRSLWRRKKTTDSELAYVI